MPAFLVAWRARSFRSGFGGSASSLSESSSPSSDDEDEEEDDDDGDGDLSVFFFFVLDGGVWTLLDDHFFFVAASAFPSGLSSGITSRGTNWSR